MKRLFYTLIAAGVILGVAAAEDVKKTGENFSKSPEKPKDYCERGADKFDHGDYLGAVADFNKALKLKPGYNSVYIKKLLPQAYNQLGNKYRAAEKYVEALKYYTLAINMAPKCVWYYYNRGGVYLEMGKDKEAVTDFDRIIKLNPHDSFACYTAGKIKIRLNDFIAAVKDFDKAIALDPDYAEAYYYRGYAKYLAGRYSGAVEDFTRAAKAGYKSALVYVERGRARNRMAENVKKNISLKKDIYKDAVRDFNKAVSLAPYLVGAYAGRADAHSGLTLLMSSESARNKEFQRANIDYAFALRLDKNNPELYLKRGKNYYDFGVPGLALKDYDRAFGLLEKASRVEQMELMPLAYFRRGNCRLDAGEYAAALADYDNVLKYRNIPHKLYFKRAVALEGMGRDAEAIKDYDKFLKFVPGDYAAWCNRGNSELALGNYKNAVRDFSRALSLNNKDVEAYCGRAQAQFRLKRFSAALADYRRAINTDYKNTDAFIGQGNVKVHLAFTAGDDECLRRDLYVSAIKDFNRAIKLDPENALAYYNRGIAWKAAGDNYKAAEDYKRSVKIDPFYAKAYYKQLHSEQINKVQTAKKTGKEQQKHDVDKGKSYEKAAQDYIRMLEIKRRNAEEFNNKGCGKLKEGKIQEALKDFDQALKIYPRLTAGYINRAYAGVKASNYQQARKDLVEAKKLAEEQGGRDVLKIIEHVEKQLKKAQAGKIK
jgi:tetratricopeptide (TPR) repeat protein